MPLRTKTAQGVRENNLAAKGEPAPRSKPGRALLNGVIVNLGIDEPVRRVYTSGTTTTNNRMRRVWAAYIPEDEYAQLVALLRGESHDYA